MSSYKNANYAYRNKGKENFVHSHEHIHNSSIHFKELVKKNYEQNGAFGYICVKKPGSNEAVSNWTDEPGVECSWAFVSPNLLSRYPANSDKKDLLTQSRETHGVKHYVLSNHVTTNADTAYDNNPTYGIDQVNNQVTVSKGTAKNWEDWVKE